MTFSHLLDLLVTEQELVEMKELVDQFLQKGGKVYVCEPFAKSKTFRTLADKHKAEYEAKKLKNLKKRGRKKQRHGNTSK
jgi:hypothetical protein